MARRQQDDPSAHEMDYDLVVVRHGESEWNRSHLFTGWVDVGLTEKGEQEARDAGKLLRDGNFTFDIAFTSYLSRAIQTLDLILLEMDLSWIPVRKSWRLNERHYGGLQGKNKIQAADQYGEEQVYQWRRGYEVRPPPDESDDPSNPNLDRRYDDIEIAREALPTGESLKDVMDRVIPYWESDIIPEIESSKKVLISAHGNSLRALVKHLEGISDEDISEVNMPTGIPKVYTLTEDDFKAASQQFLGGSDELDARMKKAIEIAAAPSG